MANILYFLKDISIDDMVEQHCQYATSEISEIENIEEVAVCGCSSAEPIYTVTKPSEKAPRKAILYPKYMFLMHQIITFCRNSDTNLITLHSGVYTEILGKHFKDMITVLKDMHIIEIRSQYEIGISSRKVSLLDWNIEFEEMRHRKVLEYLENFYQLTGTTPKRYRLKTSKKPQILETVSIPKNEFTIQYTECLKELRLIHKDDASAYIEGLNLGLTHRYNFYQSRIENFNIDELKIIKIDNDGRIYHYLTNLPKDLKRFLNIKYQLDISNSHPLLFNIILIDKYNIDINILNNIYNIIIDIDKDINIHYVGKQLCKQLIINGIEKDKLSNIPIDVLAYIYITSKGIFWDSFTSQYGEGQTRDDMKANLFREVFYSHTLTSRHKPYAKIFSQCYPNVMRVIREIKKKESNALPHQMMGLESKLFGNILQKCWKQGLDAINIHDAVILLDTEKNASVDVSKVIEVMKSIYQTRKLQPTIKVDTFQ